MSKKIKNCFYQNLTFSKLLQAHERARVHKSYKNEVIRFELNLENNLINLLNNIKNKTYHLGNYYSFTIYEPKERLIKALPYVDRIVHQWYVEEFIKPYIVPKFINTSFACLTNKGTHKAVCEVQKQMRKFKRVYGDFWVLKCDISKFFYSIDPYILFNIMKKYISDKELLNFTKLLIFDKRNVNDTVGIPIGNYSSQFFANIYLNELDQYVKRILKIKYYTRYMDDFIFLLPTKKSCIEIKNKIQKFLTNELHLSLNNKSKYYPYKMGVNFCGYRIFTTHRLLRVSSKKKIKKNIKTWNICYKKNELNTSLALQSLNSWLGHSSHCNSYKLQQKILNNCNFIVNSNYYNSIENSLIELIEADNKNFCLRPQNHDPKIMNYEN
ncbi:MAG: RNA-directed DNA polymerase [Clostridia bacterium]|nr:RNA-directed DNA polymerase [Clostridium sp.]